MQEISAKTHSELLLNVKDIEKIKNSNLKNKSEDRVKTIDRTIEKWNKEYKDAIEAPVPDINLLFNSVLVRAVPIEIKSKGGIILDAGDNTMTTIKKLEFMTERVDLDQEILLIGNHVDKELIKVGDMARLNFNRFRTVQDTMGTGIIDTIYDIPTVKINGFKYIIVDQRDIIYTYKKD